MGGVVAKDDSTNPSVIETKLEAKINEAVREREIQGNSTTSFNSIILKFPKIDESFRKCRTAFHEFDEDGNGSIDQQELRHCFSKLEINFTDEEINDLFEACDINKDMKITFNEFIVLICLVFLLKGGTPAQHAIAIPDMESTYETIVDAFIGLDKNKDGYVSKEEMFDAIKETATGERSSGKIAMKRFEEMDWDRNGTVNFKEFLFAFMQWVGIEDNDDCEDEDI